MQHINSPAHRKRIGGSEFNRHILELTQKFSAAGNEEDEHIRKHTRSTQEDDSVEIISNPVKKVKRDLEGRQGCSGRTTEWGSAGNQTGNLMGSLMGSQMGCTGSYGFNQGHFPVLQDHYNFNISMNLFLNQLPMPPVLQQPGFGLGVPFQQVLINQMSHLGAFSNPYCGMNVPYYGHPPFAPPSLIKNGKPISYIVIDE